MSDHLEHEFIDILEGNKLIIDGVVDIGLPSRFVSKCLREGFESARMIYEVCGTLDPENIACPKLSDIREKLEGRVVEYLVRETLFGEEVSKEKFDTMCKTTPYPEQAKDILDIVLGYKDEN